MMPASDSTICEATLSSIGDTSGENAAPPASAVPPIQGIRRGISFITKPPKRNLTARCLDQSKQRGRCHRIFTDGDAERRQRVLDGGHDGAGGGDAARLANALDAERIE